jgi:hypothetical protein
MSKEVHHSGPHFIGRHVSAAIQSYRVFSVLTVSVCAQSSRKASSLDPGVEEEYRALPSMSDLSLSWEERYGPRRELAKRYPADWPLQFML